MTRKILMSAVLISSLSAPRAWADEDVKKVQAKVEGAVNKILVILKDKSVEREEKRKKVMEIVDPLFDLPLTAKLVLGRTYWPKFDEKQRKRFTDLFVKQVQDSYFDKVDLLTEETVEFGKAEKKNSKIHLPTNIVAKDKRYEMVYKLHGKGGDWAVYDVEIEGISVVKSYSSQYDQYLSRNSIESLLKKMNEKAMDAPADLKNVKANEKGGAEKKEAADGEKKDRGDAD